MSETLLEDTLREYHRQVVAGGRPADLPTTWSVCADELARLRAENEALREALNAAPSIDTFDHTAPEFWFRRYRDWQKQARAALTRAVGAPPEME